MRFAKSNAGKRQKAESRFVRLPEGNAGHWVSNVLTDNDLTNVKTSLHKRLAYLSTEV